MFGAKPPVAGDVKTACSHPCRTEIRSSTRVIRYKTSLLYVRRRIRRTERKRLRKTVLASWDYHIHRYISDTRKSSLHINAPSSLRTFCITRVFPCHTICAPAFFLFVIFGASSTLRGGWVSSIDGPAGWTGRPRRSSGTPGRLVSLPKLGPGGCVGLPDFEICSSPSLFLPVILFRGTRGRVSLAGPGVLAMFEPF